jgi:hypothetical protein
MTARAALATLVVAAWAAPAGAAPSCGSRTFRAMTAAVARACRADDAANFGHECEVLLRDMRSCSVEIVGGRDDTLVVKTTLGGEFAGARFKRNQRGEWIFVSLIGGDIP